MYPQSVLDQIRERVSISALIGERIPLKKAGRNHKGLCPFHGEKTPSFMVSDEKQIYHCFGCGEGGNVFNFFMKFDGLSFHEAIEMLAARAGVTLPRQTTVDKKQEDELERKKKWAYRINLITAEYFNNNLKDAKKGEAARNYLKSRDIFLEKNTQHFLGYAEDKWDGLVEFLGSRNVPLELAAEIGVIKKREGGGYYDFFRHRIVCPVITPGYGDSEVVRGRVVAFSGRTFGEPKTAEGREPPAKYLNSPDSLVYHKSHTVYGLNVAADAVRKNDFVVLVEGNLDVMRLHQVGIENTVAPLGTALTSGHVKLLLRYTRNFVVVFDGDEAGRKAASRSLPIFLEADVVPRVVVLPTGEDPDSFVRKNGPDAFRSMIEKATTLFEWIIDDTVAKFGRGTDGKVRVVEDLKPYFEMARNPVEMALYRRRLAQALSLEESVLMPMFSRRQKVREETGAKPKTDTVEKTILELLIGYPETARVIAKNVDLAQFADGAYQTIARLALEEFNNGGALDVAGLADRIAEPELKSEILSFAMTENKYDDPVSAALDCAAKIRKRFARERLAELTFAVKAVGTSDEKLIEYMTEIQKITKELHNLNKKEGHERTGTKS